LPVRGSAPGRGVSGYRDRAVLVVGGFGFIGVTLTRELARLGARVTVVTPSLDRQRLAAADAAQAGVRAIEGDLRDARAMASAVVGQEVVFNLAGQSGAVRSMEDPWTDLDVNCRGNLVLLEALRTENPSAKLVFVSSRLAYGRAIAAVDGSAGVSEEHDVDPMCLHAVHKLAVEQYLRLYSRLYGLKFAAARLTNPYGPGQPRARTAYGVVNRMIHLALHDEPLTVYGDGHQLRDYIYIEDAVQALLTLGAVTACDGQIYNVGSGLGTSLVDMARAIVSAVGRGRVEFVPWPPLAEQIETGDFVADVTKIRRDAGWEPRTALAEGLRRTVAFYRAFAA
jgi:UDP-glucose 4-epimerase